MEPALIHLVVAAASFVGSHFLLSGPVRQSLVSSLGAQGFMLLYSIVSIATFGWTVVAFDRAPSDGMLWDGMSLVPWALASILTITALALLIPSFVRNPALPAKSAAGVGTWIPVGVFRVTRHPMMWGISLWAFGHLIASPTPRVLVLMPALILLALLGSHFQDKRKLAQNTREFAPWQRRTSFGLQLGALPGLGSLWLLAFLVWFVATWLHYNFFGVPAGLWLWIG